MTMVTSRVDPQTSKIYVMSVERRELPKIAGGLGKFISYDEAAPWGTGVIETRGNW